MSQVMEHVRELADVIGPRPATTDTEAQAADYIEGVFQTRGLDVERQEFDCPRTYSWAFVIYHLLTIGAAVLAKWWALPAFALATVVAVVMWLDLDTRFGLSQFMPKGPSQNIIARHVPRVRRGERMRRVVIVAHYDSAKASLAFSPGLVKNFAMSFGLMKWMTIITPVVILIGALPFASEWRPWTWYAALAAAAYLVVPLIINVHRELLMRSTDGANDNASGVAAMLGVMEATVPEPEEGSARPAPRRRSAEAAYEADVVVNDALLEYQPQSGAPTPGPTRAAEPLGGFDDIGWETGPLPPAASVTAAPAAAPIPVPVIAPAPVFQEPASDRPLEPEPGFVPLAGSWAEDEESWDESPAPRRRLDDDPVPEAQERLSFDTDTAPAVEPDHETPSEREAPPERERTPARESAREREEAGKGIRDWLGVGRGFDVRKAGKEIGSWDGLADDEDEFGFKAGTAGDLDVEDIEFASGEAARIRRRVTEHVDRALTEKEIWFVATGAEEAGTWGMRALLDTFGDDLKDALIINIDNVGAGTVAYVTEEGMARRYHCDRRLASQAKRSARENELSVRGVPYRGLSTDATPALARRFHAMSVMAFDINGRLPHWHWRTDTIENVQERTLEQAVEFVTVLLRDL